MTRRKLCVVCEERPPLVSGWCVKCAMWWRNGERWELQDIARRARAYERRRWIRMLRTSRCPDADWLIKNVGVSTKARKR